MFFVSAILRSLSEKPIGSLSTENLKPNLAKTFTSGKAGAKNSAILAVQILATSDDGLAAKLSEYKSNMRDEVLKKDQALNS